MRPDQRIRLKELGEKLIDTYLFECDPDEWAGAGKPPSQRTREERGDRAWDMKAVNALASVVRHTLAIETHEEMNASSDLETQARRDDILDERIKSAEDRAAAAVQRVINRAKA